MSDIASFTNCPHIGLREDRSSLYMMPTPAHSCFVRGVPFTPNAEHQYGFCLNANHANCPLYTAPVRVNISSVQGIGPMGSPEQGISANQNGAKMPAVGNGVFSGNVPLPGAKPTLENGVPLHSPLHTSTPDSQPGGGTEPVDSTVADDVAMDAAATLSDQPLSSQQTNSNAPHVSHYASGAPYTVPTQNAHYGQGLYTTPPPPQVGYAPSYSGEQFKKRRRSHWVRNMAVLILLLAAAAGYVVYTDNVDRALSFAVQGANTVTKLVRTNSAIFFTAIDSVGGSSNGTSIGSASAAEPALGSVAVLTSTAEITGTHAVTDVSSAGQATLVDSVDVIPPTPKRLTAADSNSTPVQPAANILEMLATPTQKSTLFGPDLQGAQEEKVPSTATASLPLEITIVAPTETAAPTSTPTSTAAPTEPSVPTSTPVSAETQTGSTDSTTGGDVESPERFVTPTPEPDGRSLSVIPLSGEAGWWKTNDSRRNNLSDSFLYSGFFEGETYFSVVRFDLSRIPRGAPVRAATLALTGLSDEHLRPDVSAVWYLQLIAEEDLESLVLADYSEAIGASPSLILFPELRNADLASGRVNLWQFDASTRAWLESQLLAGATSVTVRIFASSGDAETLFAWDSGRGPESDGAPPELFLTLGPRPDVAPALPTEEFIVATLTPVPENVVTAVAQAATATTQAQTVGTATPVSARVFTPTPFPQNLETVQAVARNNGLPPVLFETPTPSSPEEEQGRALYATAVAQTTGTFTPVPTNYVTPVLILPSPPAENVATVAARLETATAEAAEGFPTATPLPYNAVIAEYAIATALPENQATADADAVIIAAMVQTTGTPTPLPWNVIVITPTPTSTPLQSPTSTPLPLIVPSDNFTPTPTPTPTFDVPEQLPEFFRNKVLFISDRSGQDETYALDPNTGELFGITQSWVYPLARSQLPFSPDGLREAIVSPDANRLRQIHVRSYEYSTTRQLTTFSGGERSMSYDPAWSPTGEWIAFVTAHSGNDEIYRIRPDGSETQQLTSNEHVWDKHPSFSPDGTKIVFFSNRTGHNQIFIMNADGSNQQNVSNNEFNDAYPIWTR